MTLSSLIKWLIPVLIVILVIGGVYFIITNKTKNQPGKTEVIIPKAVNTVAITSSGFSPATITIKKDEAIKWVNQDGQTVSINSDPHPTHESFPFLNLGEVSNGSAVQTSFYKTGTFTYHNHYNPTQKGTIIVK